MNAPRFNVPEIAAWLKSAGESAAIPGVTVTITPNGASAHVWSSELRDLVTVTADSVESAVTALASRVSPTSLARQYRDKARELEVQADKLEAAS